MACAAPTRPDTLVSLDIDNVLSVNHQPLLAPLFIRKSTIITAAKKLHCIIPGAIELIRFLHHTPGLRMGFCSAGIRARNEPFVRQLLMTALGQTEYEKIIETIPILSREDTAIITKEEVDLQIANFGIGQATISRKNLALYKHPLEHVVHVDDRDDVIMPGQEKNLLKTIPVEFSDITTMYHLAEYYSPRGYTREGSIFCLSPTISKHYINVKVRSGRDVFVQKNEEKITVHFYHKEKERVESIELPLDCSLFKELTTISFNRLKVALKISNKRLSRLILDYIKPLGATLEIFCHELNTIPYVAGILTLALKKSIQKGDPISTTLFKTMYKKVEEEDTYYPIFDIRQRCDLYYRCGIDVLKRYSPNYHFMTPYTLNLVIDSPMDEEEKNKLKKALNLYRVLEITL
jgi:hypothetical protein